MSYEPRDFGVRLKIDVTLVVTGISNLRANHGVSDMLSAIRNGRSALYLIYACRSEKIAYLYNGVARRKVNSIPMYFTHWQIDAIPIQ